MNPVFSIIKTFYKTVSISDEEFSVAKEGITLFNKNSVLVLSLLCTILFSVLCVLSIVTTEPTFRNNALIYGTISVISLVCFMLTLFLKKTARYDLIIKVIMYLFMSAIFCYSIFIGVYRLKNNYAVSFFVLQFATPIFFIDRTKRMCLFTFLMTLIFSFLSFNTKARNLASMDLINAVCFFTLSLFSSPYLSKLKVAQFNLMKIIAIERDLDGLTGLFNKSAFTREVTAAIEKNHKGILMMLDCDNFKGINDNFGHDVGDFVLKEISSQIKKVFSENEITGRFGGDEFIIFIPDSDTVQLGRAKAKHLLEKINTSIFFPDKTSSMAHNAEVSIGLAVGSGNNISFGSLFKCADHALYEAKNLGKNRVVVAQDLLSFIQE
ncbi:MAG: GGDEF domain-containing protein [Treponema sp.]|nr:GGDEF domain-containing protein [Treponema sp.]